jgi:histidinol-phosphate aminotransferase
MESRATFPLSRRSLLATLPFLNEFALAQRSFVPGAPADAVFLNANENPLGPCAEAVAALQAMLPRGGRYMFGESLKLAALMAQREGVPAECVQIFAGSSDPLHRAILAFCGPGRPYVFGEPGYEAGQRPAEFINAPVHAIPLTNSYAHDVKAMVEAAAGKSALFYICNPNNPTGTITPRADIEWLLRNKPAGSLVLLDEAYIHFCDEPPCTDLVAKGADLIVLRTFSKIYGMAGLRCGAAIARRDLLVKLEPYSTGFLPTSGLIGALASLSAKDVVPTRKKLVRDTRESTFAWLRERNYRFIPSVSNKFMLDTGKPGVETMSALRAKGVIIGRAWPCWPNHVRVTIGTPEEMTRFQEALAAVLAA